MVKYILKRLLIAIFVIFGVTLITYALFRLMPDDYLYNKFLAQSGTNPDWLEQYKRVVKLYGLDVSVIKGYFTWLGSALKGDFGYSFINGAEVISKIKRALPVSFWMNIIVTVLQLVIAIPLGIRAAVKQYGATDYITTVITLLGISLPSFFFAAIAIKIFAVDLGWFDPSLGLISTDFNGNSFQKLLDMAWHLVLPILLSVILSLGGLMRYTRTNMLEVLGADYIAPRAQRALSRQT